MKMLLALVFAVFALVFCCLLGLFIVFLCKTLGIIGIAITIIIVVCLAAAGFYVETR